MFDKGLITESRLASAKKKELTPVEMSKEDEKGIFVGSEGNLYTTTLDNCSCPDFAIQGYLQPCKHMIRLAMEFGEIPDDGKASDPDAAKARYYLGKAKKFIHEAPLTQVIDFSIASKDNIDISKNNLYKIFKNTFEYYDYMDELIHNPCIKLFRLMASTNYFKR